jgi:hypothetical protein
MSEEESDEFDPAILAHTVQYSSPPLIPFFNELINWSTSCKKGLDEPEAHGHIFSHARPMQRSALHQHQHSKVVQRCKEIQIRLRERGVSPVQSCPFG